MKIIVQKNIMNCYQGGVETKLGRGDCPHCGDDPHPGRPCKYVKGNDSQCILFHKNKPNTEKRC